tara:strand:- start:29 stop:265 length:237 start_codon:yes stop_codon:yes gene_type:complete
MVGTWDHEEFYEEFNQWCDTVEEKQKDEMGQDYLNEVEEISDEELDCVSDFLDNQLLQKLTEDEYIETDPNNYNEMPF